MFLNLALRKKGGYSLVSNVSIEQIKKSTKGSSHLFFLTLPMAFLKTEKICDSDIMGQN